MSAAIQLRRRFGAVLPLTARRRILRTFGLDTQDRIHEKARARKREAFLRAVIPEGGVGAELGVFKGVFTDTLLAVAKPERLHIVDPWYLLGHEWSWSRGDRSTFNALIEIIERHRDDLASGRVVLHVDDDLDVLARWPDDHLDWVYIDSSHRYAHTLAELREARRVVKDGGVIAGDDWNEDPDHVHAGVKKAVDEFCAEGDYEIVYASLEDRQWAIRRRGAG